ncbi:MAG: group 1 truncated hemoglobin [Planctomycetes bacterium]|nr:group 1 truncated hemoglobin [Planctomycetota bacterium]
MSDQETPSTLYHRLGAEAGIEALIRRFYDRVLSDPQLSGFFKDSSLERVQRMQREFFSAALDGPHRYSGLALTRVHHNRGITGEHFNLFGQHLLATLEMIGVAPDDIREVVHRISVYKNDITGESY